MTLRVALAGLGKIARDQHLGAIAAVDGIELAATVSRNASLDGVPAFATIEALLADGIRVDAVALCTPPQPRFGQAAAAIGAGLHVLLEKPPGVTVGEVAALAAMAEARGVSLFASWHSRFAAGVGPARAALAGRRVRAATIDWREDVRVWHPGQDWIFAPGGLGVFDPGINALSILTTILTRRLFVTEAVLEVPEGRQGPIAAALTLADGTGFEARAGFDFRQAGEQVWEIRVQCDEGEVVLAGGGKRLTVDGAAVEVGAEGEYTALYRRFAALVGRGESDVDAGPLGLVADAFLVGERRAAAPFEF